VMIKELENAAEANEVHLSGDEPEDIFVWRKQQRDMYRKQYAKWRKGKSEGARSAVLSADKDAVSPAGLSPDARRDNRSLF